MTVDRISRRTALRAGGAALAGLSTGLAGCSALGDGNPTLSMGTLNVFPMMQQFVIDQQGWYDDLGVGIDTTTFGGGPPLVQAYASGDLDLAYVGISPGLVAIANGVPSTVVAANVLEPNVMVGTAEWRAYWDEYGADAFAQFRADMGRRPRFATLPAGSTPDVFLRYWVTETLGLELDVLEIIGQSSSALQSTLAAERADAGSVIEPIPTQLARDDGTTMAPFRYAGAVMAGQPGAVLQPSQSLVENRPGLVKDLVRLHIRATEFITANRTTAAKMASAAIGTDVLPESVAVEAINSPASRFIADPRRIIEQSLVYNEFHQQLGATDIDLTADEIFTHRFYEEVRDE